MSMNLTITVQSDTIDEGTAIIYLKDLIDTLQDNEDIQDIAIQVYPTKFEQETLLMSGWDTRK